MTSSEHTAAVLTIDYDSGLFSLGGGNQTPMDIGGLPGNDRQCCTFAGSIQVLEKGK